MPFEPLSLQSHLSCWHSFLEAISMRSSISSSRSGSFVYAIIWAEILPSSCWFRNFEGPFDQASPENYPRVPRRGDQAIMFARASVRQLRERSSGGSVWESNLLGADSPSTYEEGLGLNWKDLPSFGILNAAFLPPRFLHPTFLFGGTISTTRLLASRIASGTACV